MATNTINVREVPNEGNEWHASLYFADISGCEDIKAAEAGKSHYLQKLLIRTATKMTITIGSGETTSAPTTIHLGPIPLDAASGIFSISFGKKGMKVTDDLALTIDGSAAGDVMIYAEGKTCRNIL